MALLDVIIDTLKINCSVVQCAGYASEIEALFYLLFFPTVFIILFIYIVIGVVIDKAGGKEGGLRILISLTLYAFIVFQGYYNLFVSLSKLWWILLATLVGLWIFIKTMIHGRGGGGAAGSPMSGISGGRNFKFIEKGKKRILGFPDPEDQKTGDNYRKAVDLAFVKLDRAYVDLEGLEGEAKSVQLKNINDVDDDVNKAIETLHDFLEEHEELKKLSRFKHAVSDYKEQLKTKRKGEERLKKAA